MMVLRKSHKGLLWQAIRQAVNLCFRPTAQQLRQERSRLKSRLVLLVISPFHNDWYQIIIIASLNEIRNSDFFFDDGNYQNEILGWHPLALKWSSLSCRFIFPRPKQIDKIASWLYIPLRPSTKSKSTPIQPLSMGETEAPFSRFFQGDLCRV